MHGKPITDATEILNRIIRTGDKLFIEVRAVTNENLQKLTVSPPGPQPYQFMDISKDDVRTIIPKLPDLKPGDRVKVKGVRDDGEDCFVVAIDFDEGVAWVRHKSQRCGRDYSYNQFHPLQDLSQ